jgi:hypothetical protein
MRNAFLIYAKKIRDSECNGIFGHVSKYRCYHEDIKAISHKGRQNISNDGNSTLLTRFINKKQKFGLRAQPALVFKEARDRFKTVPI